MVCVDNINGNILNRCITVEDYGPLREFTQTFFNIVYPAIFTSVIIILITLLPFIFELSSKQLYRKSLRLYNIVRFTLLSLFHRVAYCYTVCSILRYLINQPAPCSCGKISSSKTQNQPYMYTCTAVMVAMTLFDFHQFSPKFFYILGAFILVFPSLFYMLSGWASLGQILFTTFLSIGLHIYSSKTSNRVMFVESIILFLANLIGMIVITYDKKNLTNFSVRDSPASLMIRGALCALFVVAHDLLFLIENKWGYFTIKSGMLIVENEQTNIRSAIMSSDDEVAMFHKTLKNDKTYGVVFFVVMILLKSCEYIANNEVNKRN
ncbi:hypothetical protein GPJ56_000245 [Histomonas meleagridis]|uniref:uncharacterized protein n=1 Tax=Histomonas meleagridis TaxID=135588 RepID=UPI003559AC08|nr:hypothetical protein GPJ56_000245 [Histomonas meleagridis]KAH0799732.1 hypothetical protein GO595_007453 [Histomonas meleagridis]